MFTIQSLVSRALKSGSLVKTEVFYVADEAEQPVTGKSHSTLELAQSELDGMAYLVEGMAYAKAQFPELADKALKGKANVIAAFLEWDANGRPVVEAKAAAEVVEEAPEKVEVTTAEDETEF